MKKKICLTIGQIVLTASMFGQAISTKEFNRLIVAEKNIYYDSATREILGCGQELECSGLPISFDFIKLNKKQKQLAFGAYINPVVVGPDTIGANYFKIFIAKPINGKLTAIRIIADVQNKLIEKDSNASVFLKQGRCMASFNFDIGDRLYFESFSSFYLKEYDLSPLISKKAKHN